MGQNFTTYAFTDSVREAQEHYGSRTMYQKMDHFGPDMYKLGKREDSFIQGIDGFYMSTVGENGWPYVQFRGGSKGFLKVLDETTLGYADFSGNMQYISTGNIKSNHRVALILMDYAYKRRLKIWAEARIIDVNEDPELAEKLVDPEYKAVVERLVVLDVKAYDWNCPQHIPQRFTIDQLLEEVIPNNPELVNQINEKYNNSLIAEI